MHTIWYGLGVMWNCNGLYNDGVRCLYGSNSMNFLYSVFYCESAQDVRISGIGAEYNIKSIFYVRLNHIMYLLDR